MDNHVHHVAIPEREASFAEGIGQLHHDFARWQHIQCDKNGHLWQNRYFSCPVAEERVWQVLKYVELNPVRARMVEHAWEWQWSSAQAHVTGFDRSGLLDMSLWRDVFGEEKWKEYLEEMTDQESIQAQVRRAVTRGYLLGSEATALRLERELGKQLLPKQRGRKPRPRN